MIQLPENLSGLLELAVLDAQKCEAQPDKFAFDMSYWARPGAVNPNICYVCMAGSVMVQSLGFDAELTNNLDPSKVGSNKIKNAMWAIDSMREGEFLQALKEITGDYEQNGAQLAAMHECALLVDTAREDLGDDDGKADHADWGTYLKCVEVLRKAGL